MNRLLKISVLFFSLSLILILSTIIFCYFKSDNIKESIKKQDRIDSLENTVKIRDYLIQNIDSERVKLKREIFIKDSTIREDKKQDSIHWKNYEKILIDVRNIAPGKIRSEANAELDWFRKTYRK